MTAYAERTVVGASASDWIPMNLYEVPFNVGFGVSVVGGSAAPTFTVQHTFDNVLAGETATAFDHSEVSGKSAAIDGNYAYPVRAVRLLVSDAGSATSSATIKILQTGV